MSKQNKNAIQESAALMDYELGRVQQFTEIVNAVIQRIGDCIGEGHHFEGPTITDLPISDIAKMKVNSKFAATQVCVRCGYEQEKEVIITEDLLSKIKSLQEAL